MSSSKLIPLRRYLIFSTCVATAALALALATAVATFALTKADPTTLPRFVAGTPDEHPELMRAWGFESADLASTFFEVVSARHEARLPSDQATPLGEAAPPKQPPVKSSPLIPIKQRLTVPGKGSIFVKGLYQNANITFYDCADQGFCEEMYNGRKVYEGAAACSWDLSIGTRFYIVGDPTDRIYICEDRGLLDNTWVDIFWHHPNDGWKWQDKVGRYATIVLVE